jgi:pimeloyl-ACP methyl ester carboxylesterase
MPVDLGFRQYGDGSVRAIVLHDWFCDHTNWNAMTPYLTPDQFTFVFADLRGYGDSRNLSGEYTLGEAASDVIALADRLGWKTFSLIGHSMSGLVVQRIPQLVEGRVSRVVAITPVPAIGIGLDQATVEMFQAIALGDDQARLAAIGPMWGDRLSANWTKYKLRRWRETVEPRPAAKYVEMWGCENISEGVGGIKTPMLIIAAEKDAPPFQAAALNTSTLPFYPNGRLVSLSECGHYPMQEQPPLLATLIERFLSE